MGHNSSPKWTVVNEFKLIAFSKDGLWAIFKPDDSQEWSEAQRQEWEQKKTKRQADAREDLERRKAQSLDAIERHKLYSEILNQFSLDAATREDLYRRGFTEAEIDGCGFKSVRKWQQLNKQFDLTLPGIGRNGKSLLVGDSGYLCPIKNFEGLITGLQLRLHNPADSNRYRWLSGGQGQILGLTVGDALENPIGVFKPQGNPQGIALCEGVGAKPYLTSQRLNLIVIGAPGGLFTASPGLLKEHLHKASEEVKEDDKLITIYPDAGDTSNRGVISRWKKVYELVSSFGYDVRFGWWNQIEKKSCPDIDELTDFKIVKYIPSEEFFKIAENQLNQIKKTEERAKKQQEKEDKFNELSLERKRLTHITDIPYKVVNVPHMGQALEELIKPGTINIIVSDTGTGKSEATIPIANRADAFYSWHNRISLGRMMSNTLGLTYKDDVTRHNNKKAAFCAPSAYQFEPKHLTNEGVLLLDECDQIFDFLFGGLCNKDGIRPLLLSTLEAHFESVISGKGIALCMSADITQKEIDYIKQLAPEGTPVRIIINKYQAQKPTIKHDPSPKPDGMINELIQKLKAGVPCFALDDMKNGIRGCKSIAEYVRQQLPEIADKVLEIHADNSNDPNIKKFFENPDKISQDYLLIVCSPSVVSGVSLKNQRFINGVFAFCNGILVDREIKQFLNRVRGAKDISLWVAEAGFPVLGIPSDLSTPEGIKDYYQRNYQANSKHILSLKSEYKPITGEWSSPHFELFCKNLAYRQITMKYLRNFTLEHLSEIGYGIEEVEFIPECGTKAVEDGLKNIWNNIEISEAQAIDNAEFLSVAEMEAIEFSQEAIPPHILPRYKKTKLRDYFGEELINVTSYEHKRTAKEFTGYAAMALKNARGDYGRALEAFYLLSQDAGEAISRDVAAENRQAKRGSGRFAGDVRWNARKRKCREWIGLHEFLDPEKWWQPQDYAEMAEKAKRYHQQVRDSLGINLEKLSAGQVFTELMRQIGLSFDSQKVEGQKWRRRKMNEESWQCCQLFVTHKLKQKEAREVQVDVTTEAVTEENMVKSLATSMAEVSDKQTYESLVCGVSQEVLSEAWGMLDIQTREKIDDFYQPVQLEIIAKDGELVTQEAEPVINDIPQRIQITLDELSLVTHWNQVILSQQQLDEAWEFLNPHERIRLAKLHQDYQTQSQGVQAATSNPELQKLIDNQVEVGEIGFGYGHFRSYVIKAIHGVTALVRKCWGDEQDTHVPVNLLLLYA